jgi:FMN phosphatase YigB (HAD superfamily)
MNKREYSSGRIVFLLDVDNTLLDNDGVQADLRRHLIGNVGRKRAKEYWRMFELLRAELGYADYLGALQLYRAEYPRDPHLLNVSQFLIDYTFGERVFPDALKVIVRLRRWGLAVILSDGDVVFQPLKINRSGLADAVSGRVLIYVHKEQERVDVEQRYPAEHYVIADDKLRILAAVKNFWDARVTTVFVRQGQYAADPKILASYAAADISIARIGDLRKYKTPQFVEPKR